MKRLKLTTEVIRRNPLLAIGNRNNVYSQRWLSSYIINNTKPEAIVPFKSSNSIKRPIDNKTPSGSLNKDEEEKKKQLQKKSTDKKANLGLMITMLQTTIPDLLNNPIPNEFVSSNIVLRILPRRYPNWPTFKGPMIYQTTVKTIQLLITSLYLNPDVKLHINSIKVVEPLGSSLLTDEELNDLSITTGIIGRGDVRLQGDGGDIYGGISPYSTKVIVKWRTCLDGCHHLVKFKTNGNQKSNKEVKTEDSNTTLNAKLGIHNLIPVKDVNHLKLFDSLDSLTPAMFKNLIHSNLNEDDHKSMDKQNEGVFMSNPSERVLNGIFIFELTADNSKISVHTIDDILIIEDDEYSHSGDNQNKNQAFAG